MDSEKLGGNNEQPNEAYDAWAKLGEVEYNSSGSLESYLLSENTQKSIDFAKSFDNFVLALSDEIQGEIRKAISEQGDLFKDSHEYVASKKTIVTQQKEGYAQAQHILDEWPNGDDIDIPYVGKIEHVIKLDGKDKYLTMEELNKNYEQINNGKYLDKRFYKGIKNDTGVYLGVEDVLYASDSDDFAENREKSRDQIILTECDKDGNLLPIEDKEKSSLINGKISAGNFTKC